MRSLLEKDGKILMHMLHAVGLNEGGRTVTSLAISPPILSIPVSLHPPRASVTRRNHDFLAAWDELGRERLARRRPAGPSGVTRALAAVVACLAVVPWLVRRVFPSRPKRLRLSRPIAQAVGPARLSDQG